MRTTVLMLSVDEAALLEHSLPAAVAQDGAEVVVVDNACVDRTAEVAAGAGARVLRLERRLPYTDAINFGIAQTGGDAILLLNADCFLQPGFLAAARPRLEEHGVGSVAPRLVRAAGPGRGLGVLDAAGMTIDRRRKNGLVGHGCPPGSFIEGAVFGVDGAAALYRRETLEDCAAPEVLDPDFEMWASDADLAWRARLRGWRCVYEPRAVALHIRSYSPSTRDAMPAVARRMQFRNRLLMVAKNETVAGLRRDGLWLVSYEIAALGFAVLRERELLGGYRDAWRRRAGVRRRRRLVQAGRRVERPPFGLIPPEVGV